MLRRKVIVQQEKRGSFTSALKVVVGMVVLGVILTALHLLPFIIVFVVGMMVGGSGIYVLIRRQVKPGTEYRKLDE